MSIRPTNKNHPKLTSLPKIEKFNPRGAWDCTPPEEQGIGFAPWDHLENDCYCQKTASLETIEKLPFDILKGHQDDAVQEGIDIVGAELAKDFGPNSFGGTDFPDIKELEPEINSFYKDHPELQAHQYPNADKNGWIQTYTGKSFYPQNPTMDSICIEDIAHALSQLCRFTGHTSVPYNVAQHCILVSYLCDPENALYGLIHDSSEAYLGDQSSPIKKLPELAGYRELEKRVQDAICRRFGLSEIEPKDVKRADLMMLSIESNTFMSPLHKDWKMPYIIPTLKIEPLSSQAAKELFLERFNQLWLKT